MTKTAIVNYILNEKSYEQILPIVKEGMKYCVDLQM